MDVAKAAGLDVADKSSAIQIGASTVTASSSSGTATAAVPGAAPSSSTKTKNVYFM